MGLVFLGLGLRDCWLRGFPVQGLGLFKAFTVFYSFFFAGVLAVWDFGGFEARGFWGLGLRGF